MGYTPLQWRPPEASRGDPGSHWDARPEKRGANSSWNEEKMCDFTKKNGDFAGI